MRGMVVEGAHGWVGKGHRVQVRPPLVPICGMRDPIEGEKRGSDIGGRSTVGGEKGKMRGEGVVAGQGEEKGQGFFVIFHFLFEWVLLPKYQPKSPPPS